MKKMTKVMKKALNKTKKNHEEPAPNLRSLLYDNRAMQIIAM